MKPHPCPPFFYCRHHQSRFRFPPLIRLRTKTPLPVGFIIFGLLSTAWFLFRTGTKPSRANYPCQKIAASNSLIFLSWASSISVVQLLYRKLPSFAFFKRLFIVSLSLVLIGWGWRHYHINFSSSVLSQTASFTHSPVGNGTPRVVWVHDENAVGSNGTPYYNRVNQPTVNLMVEKGIEALGQSNSLSTAWSNIFKRHNLSKRDLNRSYQSGEKIAIKVNFNNSGNDTAFNAPPQTVRALVLQLHNTVGIPFSDIYIYDPSRSILPSFRNLVSSGGVNVHFVDRYNRNDYCGLGPGFTMTSSSCGNEDLLLPSFITGQNNCPHTITYLINVPLLRAHGIAGITFAFKNHYGTINRVPDIAHKGISPHSYQFGCYDQSQRGSPLVQINQQPAIKNKTFLIVGDGLFYHPTQNTGSTNLTANTLIFAQDPVAADSVMFDYFTLVLAPNQRIADYQNYLHLAAQAGLGVHEHCNDWNSSQCYSRIHLVKCDPNCADISTPTSPPTPSFRSLVLAWLTPSSDRNQDGKTNNIDFAELIFSI